MRAFNKKRKPKHTTKSKIKFNSWIGEKGVYFRWAITKSHTAYFITKKYDDEFAKYTSYFKPEQEEGKNEK